MSDPLTSYNCSIINVTMYRKDELAKWSAQVKPLQEAYVTVEQCREAWGMDSRSGAFNRLQVMVSQGLAVKKKIAGMYHYQMKASE